MTIPEYFLELFRGLIYLKYRIRNTNQTQIVAAWTFGDPCPYFKMPSAFTLADDLALLNIPLRVVYSSISGYWLTAEYRDKKD